MAKLGLVRVDDRLIHGQVVTTWINATQSNRILIVDDELFKNEFIANIYSMAAPRGLTVEIKSTDQAAREWIDNQLGSGTIFVLIKSIPSLKAAYDKGFTFAKVQIGGLASGADRRRVVKAISLSIDDAIKLKKLGEKGVNFDFKSMPDEKSINLHSVLGKYFKDLT